jgi:flagellar protein FliS
MLNGAKAYLQTQVNTVNRVEVLIMLYDAAVKNLTQAKEMIEDKKPAEKGMLISKALDIIGELDSSLNSEKGGEIAQNLHSLYFYCNTRLLKANLHMDTAMIDEVVTILSGLRDAFKDIKAEGNEQNLQAPSVPPVPGAGAAAAAAAAGAAQVQPPEQDKAPAAGYPNPGTYTAGKTLRRA